MVRPRLIIAALLASLTAVVLTLAARSAYDSVDLRMYDALVRMRGGSVPSARIAVVAVDDASLAAVGQWPWPRSVMASLVDRLRAAGAAVIAFDVLFAEPDRHARTSKPGGGTGTDGDLADAIGQGRVVLGYALTFGPPSRAGTACPPHPLSAALVERPGVVSPVEHLFKATGAVCSLPELSTAAAASGFLNVGVDPDGSLRRLPLVIAYQGRVYPALALSAVRAALGPRQFALRSRRDGAVLLDMDDRTVALDERGAMALRFRARTQAFDHVPAADVLNGRVRPGTFDGRIVFVGATALGVRDVVATPLNPQQAGIDVHASAAENLLQNDHIWAVPFRRVIESGVAVGLSLAVALLIGLLGYRRGVLMGAAGLALLWAVSTALMTRWNLFLSPLSPTLALAAALAALAVTRVEFERNRADDEERRRRQAHEFLVKSLTSLMEIRDPSTGRHSRRTQGYSRLLAQRLAHTPEFRDYLTPARIETMSLLAPLHDIGKVGIRDAVLNKSSALTPDEIHEMRQHPVYGYETISKAQRQVGVDSSGDEEILQVAKDIVYTHHERWDGTGYPRGLRGDEIPVVGRIMALVDVYDALVEPRPYRRRLPHDEAVALIVAGRGSQFDPDVVEAFLTVSPDFLELGTRLRESPRNPQHGR